MKVLVVSLFSNWVHHLGTELEIIERHIQNGDDVTVLSCAADLPACTANIRCIRTDCLRCINEKFAGLKRLSKMPRVYHLGQFLSSERKKTLGNQDVIFESAKQAIEHKTDSFEAGLAASSTAISIHRDRNLGTENAQRDWKQMVRSANYCFEAVTNFLNSHDDFERAYVFNGRFAECRAAWQACKNFDISTFLHERGANNALFNVFDNHLPHDIQYWQLAIEEAWSNASTGDREPVAREFFERRRDRVEDSWRSFVKDQKQGKLPSGWDNAKRNIVIFSSSDDEFAAIGDGWKNPIYADQLDGIQRICRDLNGNQNIQVYLRMHPNLTGVNNDDTKALERLEEHGVRVLRPNDNVCSYTILERCNAVVTFGSTVGVEATYWGIPSILAGPSLYRHLDAAYTPNSHHELIKLVVSEIQPKTKDSALKYGFFAFTHGTTFEHYQAESFTSGKFRSRLFSNTKPVRLCHGFVRHKLVRWLGNHPRSAFWIDELFRGPSFLIDSILRLAVRTKQEFAKILTRKPSA